MSYGAVAAVVATFAGFATSHAFTPPLKQGAASSDSRLERQAESERPSAVGERDAPRSFEAERLPVPIQPVRRPVNAPVDPVSGDVASQGNSAISANGVTSERAARAAIERDGYKGVRALRRRPDGLWSARALRGSTEIDVTVDSTGNVSAN